MDKKNIVIGLTSLLIGIVIGLYAPTEAKPCWYVTYQITTDTGKVANVGHFELSGGMSEINAKGMAENLNTAMGNGNGTFVAVNGCK